MKHIWSTNKHGRTMGKKASGIAEGSGIFFKRMGLSIQWSPGKSLTGTERMCAESLLEDCLERRMHGSCITVISKVFDRYVREMGRFI